MPKLDPVEVVRLCREAGFDSNVKTVTALAIAWAESGLRTEAINVNEDGSRDRGLWQLNQRWHPEVSDECCFDPACAARETLRISKDGTDWSQWVTYQQGLHKRFWEAAWLALRLADCREREEHLRQRVFALAAKVSDARALVERALEGLK